ncbi:MAG: tRNA (adenosine(37)-N6)-threonylcarbamoyltransferase complex dimerization subunit type 1 TsaB, partial [Pseudomonadota bacterium]
GPPAMAVPPAAERWLGAGNGFERFEALCALPLVGCFPQAVARASVLATIAASEWNPTQALRAEDAQPVYLRDRVAEKSQPAKP